MISPTDRKELARLRRDPLVLVQLVDSILRGPPEERERALQLLESIRYVKCAIPQVGELFASADPRLRRAAVLIAAQGSRDPACLKQALWDSEVRVRSAAFEACRDELYRGGDLVRELLNSNRPELQVEVLEELKYVSESAADLFRPLLNSPQAEVRHAAATVLAESVPPCTELLEPLLEGLPSRSGYNRTRVIHHLARVLAVFPEHREGIKVMVQLLASPDEDRESILEGIGQLASACDPIARAILPLFQDPALRRAASDALTIPGPATLHLVPELLALTRSTEIDDTTKTHAAFTLSLLGRDEHVEELGKLLARINDGTYTAEEDDIDQVTGLTLLPGIRLLDAIGALNERARLLGPDATLLIRTSTEKALALRAFRVLPAMGLRGGDAEARAIELFARWSLEHWEAEDVARGIAALGATSEAGLALLLRVAAAPARPWKDLQAILAHLDESIAHLISRLEALRSKHLDLAEQIDHALDVIGVVNDNTLDLLFQRLLDQDDDARKQAIGRLRLLGGRANCLLPRVFDALTWTTGKAQLACLEVLGPLVEGEATDAVRSALARGLESDDSEIVAAATLARGDFPALRPCPMDIEEGSAVSASVAHLALALLRRLGAGKGNVVFSPWSIYEALLILLHGVRGTTQRQVHSVVGSIGHPLGLWDESTILRRVLTVDSERFTLVSASALFSQEGIAIFEEFLQELRDAGVTHSALDTLHEQEKAVGAVNAWVEQQTGGRMGPVLATIPQATTFLILTISYFLAKWEQPFTDTTKTAPFALLDGATADVPFMFRQGGFLSARGPRFDLIQLPYSGGLADMFVVAPDLGFFARVRDTFQLATLERAIQDLGDDHMALWIPKFRFANTWELTETLAAMGLSQLLEGPLDLSGMTAFPASAGGTVFHRATIDFNETGTEATAATVLFHIGSAARELTIDRPFFFVLRHRATQAIVFIGSVVDPRPGSESPE